MLIALALVLPLAQDAPRAPVDSRVAAVTVYPGSASVVRTASAGDGPERLVLRDLPGSLDPDTLRVRAEGAEVVSADLRERLVREAPEARVEELRSRVRALERELAAARDRERVLERMEAHLERLLAEDAKDHARDLEERRAPTDAWQSTLAWLRDALAENADARREASWAREEVERELEAATVELGRAAGGKGTRVRDLHLDLHDLAEGPARIEVEYVVPGAGWRPLYELRASGDLRSVELVYRAEVWQRSGEDWRDVEVALSTSQPVRGAAGPEPVPAWLDVRPPASARAERWKLGREIPARLGAPPEEVFEDEAEIDTAGLSVRYRLPRRETIETRDEPSLVLVGRAELALDPERYAVPAQDPTVWVRGRAANTSAWTLLPGRASVHVGGDFVGKAALGPVQPGEELEIHLGPDPAITLERVLLADRRDPPGLFGSRIELREEWRLRVANHRSEPVEVVLHEVVPRARDDRIRVKLADAKPSPAKGERWEALREETGVVTFVVTVPPDGERLVEFAVEIAWPEELELRRL